MQAAVFPQTSVAVYVRLIVNLLGQTKFVVTSAATVTVTPPPQLSEVTIAFTLAAGIALAQLTVRFTGQVIAGGVPSKTVIICVQVALLPQRSVAT